MPARRSNAHSGRHGPKPPNRIDGSSFHRQPSDDLAGPDRDEVAQPFDRQPRVHPAAAGGELVDRAGLALRAGGAAAMIEPARDVGHEHLGALVLGDVGDRPLRRDAVDVDEAAEPERFGVGELDHHRATLGVADRRHRCAPGDVVEHGGCVAEVGVPRVQVGVGAVAVAPMVPADHPPSGGGEERGEHVVGAGEVESAVREEEGWSVGLAPFVEGDRHTAGIDRVLA